MIRPNIRSLDECQQAAAISVDSHAEEAWNQLLDGALAIDGPHREQVMASTSETVIDAGEKIVRDVAEAFGFDATAGDKNRVIDRGLPDTVSGVLLSTVPFLSSSLIPAFGQVEIEHYRQRAKIEGHCAPTVFTPTGRLVDVASLSSREIETLQCSGKVCSVP